MPQEEEIDEINEIIMKELSMGDFSNRDYVIEIIEKYASQVDAAILGCTELPLIVKEGDVSIPVLDTARIHVEKIMREAMASRPQ